MVLNQAPTQLVPGPRLPSAVPVRDHPAEHPDEDGKDAGHDK